MRKAYFMFLAAICLFCTSSCSGQLELYGNEDSEAISYNGTEYISEIFYCADDDRNFVGRIGRGAVVYAVGPDETPQFILISGRDNSGCFIAEGAKVPTGGKITKVLIDPGIRGDNSRYLSADEELAVIEELSALSGEQRMFHVDNYYTDGNAFFYVYNNSNVSCEENYGGYIAFTEGTWIYAPPENKPVWSGEQNEVSIEAMVIEDEALIDRICETDLRKYIVDS